MERTTDIPVLDVSGLPTVVFREPNPIFWGNLLYMLIEGAMFAMIFASYFYLRTRSTEWPPGLAPPYLWYGVANTILFLTSVVPARSIQLRARAGDLAGSLTGLIGLAAFGYNLPNTILESLACATPVVAFDVGGVGDAVRHLETGWLASAGDPAALAHGIRSLLEDVDLRERLGRNGRELAEREWPSDLEGRRFAELYEELIAA